MSYTKHKRIRMIVAGMLLAASGFALADSPAPITACDYTPEMRSSWKATLTRFIQISDPSNSSRYSKIATDIIDGKTGEFAVDIIGVDPNTVLKIPSGGISLLALAAAACREDIVVRLVRMGAAANGDATSTPLVHAAGVGNANIVEFLIQNGASVDKNDAEGRSALEVAVRQRQLATVKSILKYDHAPGRAMGSGGSALDLLSKNSSDPTEQSISSLLQAKGVVRRLSN